MTLPTRDDLRSRELRLLLGLCAAEPRVSPPDTQVLDQPAGLRRFLGLLEDNALDGLALGAMERLGMLEGRKPAARRGIEGILTTLRRRAAVWVLERDRVLAHLRAKGLDPVVLKGAALCSTHYPEPAARWFEDLDLLLDAEGARAAIEALPELGYEVPWSATERDAYFTHHYHLPLHHPGGFIVEAHWALDRSGAAFRLDADSFRDEARTLGGLRLPRDEHLLLHVVAQTATDAVPRLARLVDLDRIVRQAPALDWPEVVREARAGGPGGVLALALDGARRLLGTPVPADVLEEMRPGPVARWHLGLMETEDVVLSTRLGTSWSTATFFSFWVRPGWRARLAWLRRRLAGNPDPMAWMWEGRKRTPADVTYSIPRRLARLGKFAALHGMLYARRLGR